MLRTLWQRAKDFVWNAVSGLFRTQEEIDNKILDFLGGYGTVITDPSALTPDQKRRKNGTFLTPQDAADWLKRAGIPPDYVTILVEQDYEDDNTYYHIYVQDGS